MTPTTLSTAMQEAAQMPSDEEILKAALPYGHYNDELGDWAFSEEQIIKITRAVLALHRPDQRIADLVSSLECEKRMRKDAEEDAERYRLIRERESATLLNLIADEWDFFGDSGKQLDAAIDAAISTKGESK